MNFNKILRSLFGDKSSRDMKLIQPLVEKVKAAYPDVQKLDNDQLRQRTKAIQRQVQDSANAQKEEIEKLKATIEDTPIDERESIFNQIDKLEKEVLDIYEKALDEVMPEVFAIVKETARRFADGEYLRHHLVERLLIDVEHFLLQLVYLGEDVGTLVDGRVLDGGLQAFNLCFLFLG